MKASGLVCAATLVAHLGWLGWDQPSAGAPRGIDAPSVYEPWQVIGLAVSLAVVSGYVIWQRLGVLPLVAIPGLLGLAAAVDAMPDAMFWPLDAAYAAVGGGVVVILTLALVRPLRAAESH